MNRFAFVVISGAMGVMLISTFGLSQETPTPKERYSEFGEFSVHDSRDIVWKSGPPSLPTGAQIAVLEGDPTKAGPFVFRVKVPDGFIIPPHTHPNAERVTVIAGTFHIAMGEKVDKSLGKVLSAGGFGYWPAGMKHYAWATGETIVQFHGHGPWQIVYLNPADDPRKGNSP